jgi:plasmid maintenance system antidote protein VapI
MEYKWLIFGTMNKLERLDAMYEYARKNGACTNKKTFAKFLGTTESVLSRFYSGGRELTDQFLLRVNVALGSVFSTSWVLYGEGDMFAQSEPAQPVQEVTTTASQPVQEVVVPSESRRVELLETLVKTLQREVNLLERYNNHLEEENEALKKANSSVYVARAKNA